MQTFVEATTQFRRTTPGFPPDGVLATLPEGRYVRFWLPATKDPGTLGELINSWDVHRHRKARDCTGERLVQSMIDVLYQSNPDYLALVGYPAPTIEPPPPLFRTRGGDAATTSLLSLRGDAARAALARSNSKWLPCARLAVHGRCLVPCDLGQLPQAADWALKVEPGIYDATVRLKISTRGDWPVITALRLVRDGAAGSAALAAGAVDVDTAALAIYDRQPFQRRFRIDEREAFADEMLALTGRPCVVVAGRKIEILVVPTGEGDGRYPIRELRDDHGIIGMQIEFIADAALQ